MDAKADVTVQGVEHTLTVALRARNDLRAALGFERYATTAFMRNALLLCWSWERIGEALGITGTAARRYYNRNK